MRMRVNKEVTERYSKKEKKDKKRVIGVGVGGGVEKGGGGGGIYNRHKSRFMDKERLTYTNKWTENRYYYYYYYYYYY